MSAPQNFFLLGVFARNSSERTADDADEDRPFAQVDTVDTRK